MNRFHLLDFVLLIVLLLADQIQMASLPHVYKHGCVVLGNQHIYCFGGALRTKPTLIAGQTYFDDDQLYNRLMSLDISKPLNVSAANTQWQTIEPTSTPLESRADFAIMALADTAFDIVGGIGSGVNKSVTNLTLTYRPKENSWKGQQLLDDGTQKYYNSFDTSLFGQRGTQINNMEYAIFGGMPNDNNTIIRTNTTFLHLVSSDTTWRTDITAYIIPTTRGTGMFPDSSRRSRGAIATGIDSEVFIFGGVKPANASDNSNYQDHMIYTDLGSPLAYHTQRRDFRVITALGTSPELRELHTATTIPKVNKIILYGGINNVGIPRDFCWLFDVVKRAWETVQFTNGNGPGPRFGHQAVMVGDEMLYIIGGIDDTGAIQNDVHILNVTSMTWLNGSYTNTYEQMMVNQPVETTPSAPLSPGAIAGIVIGCVAGVAMLVTAIVIIHIHRKKKAMMIPADAPEGLLPGPVVVEYDKVKPDAGMDDKIKPDAGMHDKIKPDAGMHDTIKPDDGMDDRTKPDELLLPPQYISVKPSSG